MRLSEEIGDNINYVRAFTVSYWYRGGFLHCKRKVDCYEIVRDSDGSISELRSLTNHCNYYSIEKYSLHIVEEVKELTDFENPIRYEVVFGKEKKE